MMKVLLKPTTAKFFTQTALFFFFLFLAQISFGQEDPDMPNLSKYKLNKEEFMNMRAEAIGLLRGIDKDHPLDPTKRIDAIRLMQEQKSELQRRTSSPQPNAPTSPWVEIGPNPIPNGQVISGPALSVSGRTIAIAVNPTDPNIVYVGTAQGGLYRSLDGGTTWVPLLDNALSLAINTIAIAPSQPNTIFVGTGEAGFSADSFFGVGIYRIDNAASATPTITGPIGGSLFTGRSIGKIVVHPTDPNIIFVTSCSGLGGIGAASNNILATRGVFRSTNALSGTPTFTKLTISGLGGQDRSFVDIVMDPGNPDLVLCTQYDVSSLGEGGVYRSTDALSATPTFVRTFIAGVGGSASRTELALHRSAGGVVTVYAASGFNGGTVQRSIDGGATWTQRIDNNFCGGQCFYNIAIDVDPTNADRVYLGGTGTTTTFAFSTNGGTSFTNSQDGLHTDSHAIAVAPSSPSTIYFGSDGGIYKSTNSGATWASLNNSTFRATQFMSLAVHPTDPNFTIGGTQDNGTNWYQPAGTWTRADFGDGGYSAIDQNAANNTNVTMYHTYFNRTSSLIGFGRVLNTPCATEGQWAFKGIYGGAVDPTVYCDGSTDSFNGISISDPVLFYAPLVLGPGNPNTVYFGTSKLYRSANKGDVMPAVSQNLTNPISAIGISPQDDNVRIVGQNSGGLFGTTTGSSTLTNLDAGGAVPNNFIARALIDPNNVNTAYVTLSAFGVVNVWKTTNLNNANPTWTSAAAGIPLVPVNAFVVDPANSNNLFAGTDIGVYASTDAGASWLPYGTGLPIVAVFGMAIAPGNILRIATHGRGMWQISLLAAAVPPTVTINQAVGQLDPTTASPINFTIVFSEPVTGFTGAGVNLSGTAGATTKLVSGTGATYNVAVSGMTGSGTVIATVSANAATGTINVVGNATSTSIDNTVTYNMAVAVPPTVTINQAVGQLDPTTASPINFTVVFSEPVTGFATGDVTLSGTAGATTAIVSGAGPIYNVAVSGMTGSGTVTATIMAGVATGTVNITGNAASTSTDNTVTYNLVTTYDVCSGALPIACGQTITGTTVGASLDAVPTCTTTLNTAPGVWYTFVGDGTSNTLSLCGSGYDTKIGVFSGTCAALVCVTGNDDFCGLQSQVTFTPVNGTTYYVLVTGFSTNAGAFTLSRTCACPPLSVDPVANQTVCNNSATMAVNFTGTPATGVVYTWTNNTPSIGLAASGTGNIASFTATNSGTTPVTATITVTPTYIGCPDGPSKTFTITVAPTPTVDQPANQTVCNGTMTAPVNFTSPVVGTMFNWTNSNPAIGLGASGTGNIPAFTATNGTTLPITGTITVTPTFAGGPLVSTPVTFSNTGAIQVPATPTTSGIANPYPSGIVVSGLPTTGVAVQSVTLTGIQHTFASDIDILLVAPNGQKFVVMSDIGGATGFDAVATITLKDGSPALPTGSAVIPSGTYAPTSVNATSTWTAPAPAAPYNFPAPAGSSTFANIYNTTTNYNGNWNLYVVDDLGGDAGTIAGGWSITLASTLPGDCAGPSKTFNITVNPTPTITCPGNITTASDVGVCNKTVTYTPTVTGTPAPMLSYVLTGATTGSGAGSGSGLKFNVGVTTVAITATNTCATVMCSFTVTVTDIQLPTITTQPANRTVCAGSNATFTVVAVTAPSAGGSLSYQWQLWNGSTWNNIAGATAATLTLNSVTQSMNTNSYRVQVIGLCTTVTSGFATLYVNPLPTINLTTSIPPALLPTQVLTITATTNPSGGSYMWFKNGVLIPGVTGNTLAGLTVDDIGTYYVVYTDANGCKVTSATIAITGQPSNNLYVYPVPNQGVFNVRFYNQSNEQVTVRVFDAKGAQVYSRKVLTTVAYTTINVDLSTNKVLPKGTYVVEVRGAEGKLKGSKKIIVY